MEWDSGPISCFCMWRTNFLNSIYWRDCPVPVVCFGTFVKDQLTTNGWVYVWALSLVPFVDMYVFMPLLCCFGYYSFVAYLEISAISKSGSEASYDSSDCVFCLLARLVIFCWKADIIWLGVKLCLLFAIAVVSEAKISPNVLGFVFSVLFGYP